MDMRFDVATQDHEYEAGLLATVYEPVGAPSPAPVVVDVHGGAWSMGDRTQGRAYGTSLASQGIRVVAVDFRQGPDHRHPVATEDIADAVRWTGGSVVMTGSSSGGHLALLAALREDIDVNGVCVLWAPVDPLARYRYAKEAGLDRLVVATEAYFGDEQTMRSASATRVVQDREAKRLPPIWVLQCQNDLNVPPEITLGLVDAYRAAGGDVSHTQYEEAQHGLFGAPPETVTRFHSDLASAVRRFASR